MLRWFMRKRIAAFERAFDYDSSYMRHMVDASPGGFMKFARVMALSQHREDAPMAAWYAAKLAATLAEDCGPCVQLVTKMARADGVADADLRAIIAGKV